ncbi:MAG: efflux RND transporter periplasmic adaptor subunit, partial [Verrucomicrobiota bacterium]|nr:efflux RND transporter periplasmic adaptor subunit [Verrucomicrobiota bacterium]
MKSEKVGQASSLSVVTRQAGSLRYIAIFAALTLLFGLGACSKMGGNSSKESNVDYYTCTMHPSVHKKDPGTCPICSMDLVPVLKKGAESSPSNAGSPTSERKIKYYKSTMMAGETNSKPAKDSMNMDMVPVYEDGTTAAAADSKPSEFTVPVERQQQIGVQFATVERKPLHHSVRAVGMLETDKGRDWQFVARVDGYVQKLFVTSPGEIVEKDAPLMAIYSPELLTTERELVQLLGMRDRAPSREARETPEKLIDAAKRRLRQWYVTDEQLAELEKSRTPSDNLTLLSPFRGVVQAVPVVQGKSVKMGDALVDVADLAVVWAWAEFYENEVSMLEKGQKVTVTAKSYP